jgi:hypothetical protein
MFVPLALSLAALWGTALTVALGLCRAAAVER